MRRFALAIIVALLTFSASGVSALIVAEPCTGYELPGREDGSCPPTCVTCGCCAQAVEPVAIPAESAPEVPNTDVGSPSPGVSKNQSRDILHVPKLRLA
jgi:hypothetical protein